MGAVATSLTRPIPRVSDCKQKSFLKKSRAKIASTKDLFTPVNEKSSVPFSVEFALMELEEQMLKCQMGEISHPELQNNYREIRCQIERLVNRKT